MPQKKKATKSSAEKPVRLVGRLRALRDRRAHKSFALTSRRDIPKRTHLPGYISFTRDVFHYIWRFRRPFSAFLGAYVVAALLLIGASQQDQYLNLSQTIREISPDLDSNGIGTFGQIIGTFGATVSGSLNASLSETQQFYLIILYIFSWLVLVWLGRQLLSGNVVRFRDALYNAGTPFISASFLFLLMILQAVPGALGITIFSIATQNGILNGGVAAMMFGIGALLLVTLSLYWLTSTFIAQIIVTLPGTYPMVAVRGASDIALGRRLQLMLRLLWLVLIILLIWAVILIPVLLLEHVMNATWLPLIPVTIQILSGLSFILGVNYIYMLYRRMIDEPAK